MATVVTKTIKPSGGGDYTTLAAWATARLGVALVNTVERAEVYGAGAGGGGLTIPASTSTDATSLIEITAFIDDRHSGVPSTGKAFCGNISGSIANLKVKVSWLYITAVGTRAVQDVTASGTWSVENCIAYCVPPASGTQVGISGCNASNCICYSHTPGYGRCFYVYTNNTVVNCTAVGFGVGFYGYTGVVKNCLAQSCTDGFYSSFNATSEHNCSSISGDAPGAHSVTGTVQFVDAANHDYHLAATDTVARGAGVNLTSSGITTDIDGETRPATGAWDIGADQYTAPPSTGPWGTPKFGVSRPFGATKFGVTPWM